MTVTALKEQPQATRRASAEVVRLAPARAPVAARVKAAAHWCAVNVIPPVVVTALLLVMWELLCAGPTATL
ncbi:MAG: hypothetical protein B7Y65_03780, partial [Azorhizobium sp. 35-67-15]